ncbi:Chromate resistance protein ChrB [Streptomyces scopuliridis]|uniref:Chromate resistance protein ChrB n=1 Tax=Streptomyces scopuliridis TaxID=452529 RepID=UPI0036A124AD
MTDEQASERAAGRQRESSGDEGWLLVAVSTAGAADSLRVAVWRKLRGLGAVYVQQSVCLLPDRAPVAGAVRRLVAKVRAEGGTARCLHLRLDDPVELGELIGEFRAAVAVEYGEVLERLPAFFTEIEAETVKGRTTYAEVEESEADLTRFESWVAKITARDYFAAPAGAEVRAELERARAAMAAFEAAALAAETTTAETTTAGTAPASDTARRTARPRAVEGHRP